MHDFKINTEYLPTENKDKLLILGAGSYQMHLIEQARLMDAYVIVVTPRGDYPGILAADKVYFHDAKEEAYVYEIAASEQVNGIISDQGEIFVRAIAYAAEKMGLPGNGYSTAMLYTDKYKMRQKTRSLGLATIDYKMATTFEEAESFFEELGTTAIIKPVDSFSSRGVSKIESLRDLHEKFSEAMSYSRSGRVIIERFINGPQFEVDSIAVKGHVQPLMYADLEEFNIPNVFSSRTRLYPSVAGQDTIDRLLEYNQKVNVGFGMILGLSHNEYIMDERTGEIYLIEAALRGGGTFIASHIAKLQTGLDTAEFLVNAALGRINDIPEFAMNQCHSGYFTFYLPVGEVISAEGVEAVESLEYVVKTTLDRIHIHSCTSEISDKDQRHAIVLFANSRQQILERIDTIKSMLNIRVSTDTGIKGPIWE